MKIKVWLALQPNGVVFVTKNKPELQDDDYLIDDREHEFFIVGNNEFGLTEKSG